jgi:ribosomal protein S12 methylthiotransferase
LKKNSPAKSFYITTLGCPKNTADSLSISRSLVEQGIVPTNSPEKSDFHIINTCTFIRSATEETIETILDATKIKKKKKQKLVIVGCFAERYPGAIEEEIPEVDFFFGTGKYSQAGQLLKEKFPQEFQTGFNTMSLQREEISRQIEVSGRPYSYIKVSDGCNRGCHFCIIPNLRGEFKDYPASSIVKDATVAVENGAKEICIVSQDTVFYARDISKLEDVIEQLTAIEQLKLLRLLYLYPDKKTWKLLDTFQKNPKIAPYFESPVQHVSEKVLKSMNRSGSYAFFKELFAKAREVEGLEIRTSLIMGYPGETAEDVDMAIRFVQEVKPEKLALFAFSPEEGTKAFEIEPTVTEKEAAKRVNLVRQAHLEVLKEVHLSRVGKTYPAIVDEIYPDHIIARRFQDAPEIDEVVHLPLSEQLSIGDIGKVKIHSFMEYDMEGSWEDV